jgi:hypothetical protein
MIYKQKVNIPSSHKVIEHNVSSCIKCGSDNISIEEYEDNFGYISTAKCRDCTHEIKSNTPISGVIIKWNEANDIPLVIADRERLLVDAKNEIKAFKKLLNSRKRAK